MNYLVIALTVVGAAQAVVLWVVSRRLNRLDQVEARLGHLTDALTLLAETAESGFRANAQEVARIADGMTPQDRHRIANDDKTCGDGGEEGPRRERHRRGRAGLGG